MHTRGHTTGLRMCCAILTLALILSGPAKAQLTAPLVPAQADPIPNGLTEFATANPQCTEMTNGCEVCVRDAAGKIDCSTPGIACQPVAWQCKKSPGSSDDSAKSAAPSK